jgi:transcriptional regulator with XRE-family HTH domain
MTGNQLKECREEFDLTQVEFALAVGKSPQTIARWEQLKEDEIPDSRFLELAIKGLKVEMAEKNKKKTQK